MALESFQSCLCFLSLYFPPITFSVSLCVCVPYFTSISTCTIMSCSLLLFLIPCYFSTNYSRVSLMAKHLHNERWGEMIGDICISHALTFYGRFQHVLHQRYMAREIISPCPPSQSQISVNLSSFFFAT